MKRPIGPLAKLDYFCTQKKINAFSFSQAQTSWRGGLIRAFHLLLALDLHVLADADTSGTIDYFI